MKESDIMQSFLNQLDENLIFIKSEIIDNAIKIFCEFKLIEGKLVHSRKIRVIKDIPFGSLKVELHLLSKKYFNDDPTLDKLTVAEKVNFIGESKRRTRRLDEYILNTCKEMSAIGCERFIKENIADVSDTTILRLIKKKRTNQ